MKIRMPTQLPFRHHHAHGTTRAGRALSPNKAGRYLMTSQMCLACDQPVSHRKKLIAPMIYIASPAPVSLRVGCLRKQRRWRITIPRMRIMILATTCLDRRLHPKSPQNVGPRLVHVAEEASSRIALPPVSARVARARRSARVATTSIVAPQPTLMTTNLCSFR